MAEDAIRLLTSFTKRVKEIDKSDKTLKLKMKIKIKIYSLN